MFLRVLPGFLLCALASAMADVRLPAIISDHMVLKKASRVPIWGKADPGEEVSVTLNSQSMKATADADGRWQVALDLADSASGPFEMTVQGKNQIKIADVVVGEVWVASGQSNMEFPLAETLDGAQEVAASANPFIRQFLVTRASSREPVEDCEGAWVTASPATSGAFSAVAYFFAKTLQNELKVPVGLIQNAWAGSPLEAWISGPALDTDPDLMAARERLTKLDIEYPEIVKNFVTTFPIWLKETGREDKPTPDLAAFAGPDISTEGWVTIDRLHGVLNPPGIPHAGAFWLRAEIDISASAAGKELPLKLGSFDAFDSVYWNGEYITGTPYTDYPGTDFQHRRGGYKIRAARVKEGKNVLAVRIYAPVGPVTFAGSPAVGSISLKGPWLAKTEYEFPALAAEQLAATPKLPPSPPSTLPAYIFNAMVNPILSYAISGVIWYQGETNIGRTWQYRTTFPMLIEDWRAQWKQGDFPFYFCQVPAYQDKKPTPEGGLWAELREAQAEGLKLPNTGQAVLIDLGESGNIHPRQKKPVGERLAKIALARDHGKNIPFSGPVFSSSEIEDGKIRVKFSHTDGGLVAQPLPATSLVSSITNTTIPLVRNSPGSELEGFAICGADMKWIWADAKIDGDSVLVWSDKIPAPVAVRYAWADNPTCNLYNGAGLPATPFRTDTLPYATKSLKL